MRWSARARSSRRGQGAKRRSCGKLHRQECLCHKTQAMWHRHSCLCSYNTPMPTAAPPVRPVTLDEIYAARERIRGVITRTPLIKLLHNTTAPEIWLKLDNLQPINAFKIRG